ncbi:MAG: cell division protein SepF [Clostridia bacterium]|nr:cell division protein SepF [Clostridia bacterium]MBR0407736.1 cell division protein SepF [Clostridia bacterium]
MAFADLFTNVKNKISSMYSNFFYEGKDVPSAPRQERAFTSQEPTPPQPTQNAQWPSYQQPAQQQPYYGGYQQTYQPVFPQQQAAQNVQPQQTFQPQYSVQQEQPQQQSRFRRSAQHASNVVQVDFGHNNPPQQTAQAPVQESAQQQTPGMLTARVINARGMSDCRSAITLLRNGDAVLIVMENITNPGDMRRLVDTLSGACYSLTATITKVSRYGVYLLAPSALAVFADQATNRMNAGPVRGQAQGYQPNQYAAPQQPMYTNPLQPAQQPYGQQPSYSGQQQDFTPRTAAPEQPAQEFYQRPMPQDSAIPAFSNRPAGTGYAPDEQAAAAQ